MIRKCFAVSWLGLAIENHTGLRWHNSFLQQWHVRTCCLWFWGRQNVSWLATTSSYLVSPGVWLIPFLMACTSKGGSLSYNLIMCLMGGETCLSWISPASFDSSKKRLSCCEKKALFYSVSLYSSLKMKKRIKYSKGTAFSCGGVSSCPLIILIQTCWGWTPTVGNGATLSWWKACCNFRRNLF